MNDARFTICEDQHDRLAGRVATLEAQVAHLLKTLARPAVLEKLNLDKYAFESTAAISAASIEQSRQSVARMEALSQARKDKLLERLERAEAVASLTGQSFAEAYDRLVKDDGSRA